MTMQWTPSTITQILRAVTLHPLLTSLIAGVGWTGCTDHE